MNSTLFLGFIIANSGFSLLRALTRRRFTGWAASHALVLAVLLGLWQFAPQKLATWGGLVWCLVILIPIISGRLALKDFRRGRYGRAKVYGGITRALHPGDGWPEFSPWVDAVSILQLQGVEAARASLQNLAEKNSRYGPKAKALLLSHSGKWDELAAWFLDNPGMIRDHEMEQFFLEALGRSQRYRELLRACEKLCSTRRNPQDLQLLTAAFLGRTDILDELQGHPQYHYFQCIALMASGQGERLQFESKEQSELFAGIPVREPSSVDEESERKFAQQVSAWSRIPPLALPRQLPRLTTLLLGILVVVFLMETRTGASDLGNLHDMGALLLGHPSLPWTAKNLFLANFLHFGEAHLMANLFAIYLFGSFLESVVGKPKYLALYLLSGFLGLGLVALYFHFWPPVRPTLLVGASAAVFGLIGASISILLRHRAKFWGQRKEDLKVLVAILFIQFVFDNAVSASSGLGHMGGFLIGFSLGFWLLPWPTCSDGLNPGHHQEEP